MKILELKNIFISELLKLFPKEEILSFFYLLSESYIGLKKIDIALDPNLTIHESKEKEFFSALAKLKKEIPIQYILGETEFLGLPFLVNKNVLIPRPETEELVNWIIQDVKNISYSTAKLNIIDIGTGSGCIAISLAKHLPKAKIWAIDVSNKAIEIAKQNAKLNNVDIHFLNKNILNINQLPQQFDFIISNPPYVRENEKSKIKTNVLKYEPHLALFVKDEDPLIFYKKIADFAMKNLNKNGKLYFEINQFLGKDVLYLLKGKKFQNIELKKDIFGNDRMVKANIN